ncbi:ATP-binding protein [Streptomyces sp. NPDC056909]|uniref:ATP-binding protein n=1 Tax=Streptomyces sp. NPDC056909 TaxID=3345963 RepID=UPI0036A27139
MTEHTVRRTAPEHHPLDTATRYGLVNQSASTDSTVALRWVQDPRCVAFARSELRKALVNWNLSVLADSAVLILSELLGNAALHAKVTPEQAIETYYVRRREGVRIEVHDGSAERPQPRPADLEAPTGRGLLLVEVLADEWGVADRDGPGKVVWAELALPVGQSGEGGCW